MKPSELFTKITRQTGLYNIMAIDNIPSVMKYGLLSNERASQIAHKSIAMQEVQSRRELVKIPYGMRLHQYVNLYFDPRNPMLYKRKDEKFDICILKLDRAVLDFSGTIVSDRNASSRYASFYPPEIGLKEIDFTLVYASDWTDNDEYSYYRKKSIKCAEILVPNIIPPNFIVCAAVYDEEEKQKLKSVGFDKKIYVDPKLFFGTEARS